MDRATEVVQAKNLLQSQTHVYFFALGPLIFFTMWDQNFHVP